MEAEFPTKACGAATKEYSRGPLDRWAEKEFFFGVVHWSLLEFTGVRSRTLRSAITLRSGHDLAAGTYVERGVYP